MSIQINLMMVVLLAALCGNAAVLYYIRGKLRARLDKLERLIWDAPNLAAAVRPRSPLPRPGAWATSTDFLVELVQLIETRRPAVVVELGSGLSTVVMALKLAELGCGRLVSIDHDGRFAETTRRCLEANGVATAAEIRVVPLVRQDAAADEPPWYDTRHMQDLVDVDLLVIDGPPMPVDPLVRKPALPFFRSRLAPGATVLLDDAARKGERIILADWRRLFPDLCVENLPLEKGAARITLKQAS
jgi:hypothetical protein